MRTRMLLLTAVLLPALASAQAARVTINGRKLTDHDRKVVTALESASGRAAIPGDYWYDDATGALGAWGGPTQLFLRPGLKLGGKLPADASGGGDGRLTGVFVNGRELHPSDVQALTAMLGTPVLPGRWWVDAKGNTGREGEPVMFNLFAVARQNGRSPDAYYRRGRDGDSTFVSKGCTAVSGHTGSGSSKSNYSYYVGCD